LIKGRQWSLMEGGKKNFVVGTSKGVDTDK